VPKLEVSDNTALMLQNPQGQYFHPAIGAADGLCEHRMNTQKTGGTGLRTVQHRFDRAAPVSRPTLARAGAGVVLLCATAPPLTFGDRRFP